MPRSVLASATAALLVCGFAPADEQPAAYTLQIKSDDKGKIANLTLRGEGLLVAGIDFKTDRAALEKRLKEIATKHKDKVPPLRMEIERKLLQEEVVALLDAVLRAGFQDVSPVPLDQKDK